jgi:EmrB/QacA subfamily drug resistance transporter
MNSDAAGRARRWTIVLAGMGLFMTALDNMVVTTALPALRTSLHAGLSGLEWTVNAYLLAFACFLLTGAALGDRFGRRRMFVVGVALFTAASAAAALAPSIGALIAARVVQGIGAAIASPLTLTLISEAFPAEKRGAAIGMWSALAGTAAAFGPMIGGAVVEGISWHWIFWVNVPVGIAIVALAPTRLRESHGPRPRFDAVGVALAALGALGITWALVRGNDVGWGSAEVLASLAAGAAFGLAFLLWESRAPSPMIPLGLFRRPGFAAANIVSFSMYGAVFGVLFMLSQLFQFAQGHSPLVAGLLILPWTLAPGVISPLAGALADRFGNRVFMAAGLLLQAAGFAWIACVAGVDTAYLQLGFALLICGVGIGLVFPTVANAALSAVPPGEAGVASGANGTVRELGGVFGVAILAAVFSRHGVYASHATFAAGFRAAMWVAVALSVLGVAAAVARPRRRTGRSAALDRAPA